MNQIITLMNRLRKLEEVTNQGEKKTIFLWGSDQAIDAGPQDEIFVFRWEGEGEGDHPRGPVDDVLPGQNIPTAEVEPLSSTQRPRMPSEDFKISGEGLDMQIQEAIDDLEREGLSKKEIQKIIIEEEEDWGGGDADLVKLMGGMNKRGRFDINKGE